MLTVTETGYGRLSELDDYRIQMRGGKGLINYHTKDYGNVAAIKVVDVSDDIILIASDGIIIRMAANEIRLCRRPSKGVRVMRLEEDAKIVSLARSPQEDEEDEKENTDLLECENDDEQNDEDQDKNEENEENEENDQENNDDN